MPDEVLNLEVSPRLYSIPDFLATFFHLLSPIPHLQLHYYFTVNVILIGGQQ